MGLERFMEDQHPRRPHLARGEVGDLRKDVEEAFCQVAAEVDSLSTQSPIIISTSGGTFSEVYRLSLGEYSISSIEVCAIGQEDGAAGRCRFCRRFLLYRDDADCVVADELVMYPDFSTNEAFGITGIDEGEDFVLLIKGRPSTNMKWRISVDLMST